MYGIRHMKNGKLLGTDDIFAEQIKHFELDIKVYVELLTGFLNYGVNLKVWHFQS